ncbi:MAG: hypothetical protein ACYDER_16365 [Ktedonobacteraceae bacterium]
MEALTTIRSLWSSAFASAQACRSHIDPTLESAQGVLSINPNMKLAAFAAAILLVGKLFGIAHSPA